MRGVKEGETPDERDAASAVSDAVWLAAARSGWGRIGRPGAVRETGLEIETAAIEAGAKVRQRK